MVLRITVIGQSGPISERLRAAAYTVGRAAGARGRCCSPADGTA